MKFVQTTKVDHKRPNQFGNPYIAYFWDELSPEDLPQSLRLRVTQLSVSWASRIAGAKAKTRRQAARGEGDTD